MQRTVTVKAEFEREGQRIIDCASVKGVFYAALENESGRFALVVPFQWHRSSDEGNWQNYTFKTMDESCGPNDVDCPARILDLLSPLEQLYGAGANAQWARKWRETCRARAEKRAAKPAVRKGDVVEFSEPIKFQSGAELTTFVFEQGSRFKDEHQRWSYKLGGKWRDLDYRNLSAEARANEQADAKAGKIAAAFKPRATPASRPSGLAERFTTLTPVRAHV